MTLHRLPRVAAVLVLVLSATVLGTAAPAQAGPNVTINPSFEIVNAPYVSYTGSGNAGLSAAANWGMWINGGPYITTDLVPSTAPGGGSRMLHVTTNSSSTGLVQAGLAITHGAKARFGLWVFVVQGRVQVGVGANGVPGIGAVSSIQGAWQYLSGVSTSLPVYEIIIYSKLAAGDPPYADFYVDLVDIQQI